MATTKKTHYVADGQPEEQADNKEVMYLNEQLAYDDADEAAVCTTCGELLAWHEQACTATPATLLAEPAEELEMPLVPGLNPNYAYALGHRVQPAPNAQAHAVIWRGQVKERHPATGLVHRVNVYRLNNGFWDCYYEQELLAA